MTPPPTPEEVEEAKARVVLFVSVLRGDRKYVPKLAPALETLLTTIQTQASEIEGLKAESADLTKALTGLTCGGSEFFVRKGERFMADIPACVAWVRRSKQGALKRTVEAVKAQRALQSALDEALKALRVARDFAELEIENRGVAGGEMTDYQDEAQMAFDACDAVNYANRARSHLTNREGGEG
jgi:predicted O-linked N-acetylglucosamine transferase (SPINDLY family)